LKVQLRIGKQRAIFGLPSIDTDDEIRIEAASVGHEDVNGPRLPRHIAVPPHHYLIYIYITIEQANFDTYNSMRIAEMPKVEAIVMPSGGFWGGVGEPMIFVAAPAVLNAFFAATGKRIRSVPLKNISFA